MSYENLRIRYNVNYYRVLDRASGKEIPGVVWIDDERGEYGQLDLNGTIVTRTGDIQLQGTRKANRRQGDRRSGGRRRPEDRRDNPI